MIEGCDWLDLFERNFGNDREVNCLKTKAFRGSITIHFDQGMPLKYKLELWGAKNSNLTKGGKDV